MVWRRIFQPEDEPESQSEAEGPPPEQPQRAVPPHIAERLNLQPRRRGSAVELRRRLARLENQREQTQFDIAQGELALEDDNPWKQRVALLTETLETVEADRKRVEQIDPEPFWQVPPVPITDPTIRIENDVASVGYTVGDERFTYEEPLDWAERGHQIARMELQLVEGQPEAVLPETVPAELREPLLAHLDHSLFVFATVLRDRHLDEEPLPTGTTLADLAWPCPDCGGWMDFRGRCQACARRRMRLQELFQERSRLLNERAAEIEEQHRIAERLPLARKQLRDIELQISELKQKVADTDESES